MRQFPKNNNIPFIQINRTGLGALALAAMAVVLPACGENEVGEIGENVTTEDVVEETDQLLGQEVTVRNEVAQQVDDFAFTMEDDEFFGGQEILVINASGEPTLLPEDIPLQATGEVVEFVLAEVESEFGLDLDDELYVDYEEQPAIIAQSIALSPDAETVVDEPDLFYGQTIAVQGDIAGTYGSDAFVMHDEEVVGDDGLLVIGVDPATILEEGSEIVATGEIRPFIVSEIEAEYDYDWSDWDQASLDELEAEYANKPVVIAREVYPSAVE